MDESEEKHMTAIDWIRERVAKVFRHIPEVQRPMMEGDTRTPYQNVFMQECEQMNALISCILSTLKELERGFAGELNMTDSMEALMMSLYENRVPTQWEKLSWPSKHPLMGGISNLQDRLQQLSMWAS